jgi:uncharacterized damage-inducible protein DinB
MTFNEIVIRQLKIAQGAALRNLDGVTHEESIVRPASGANDANWVVGHMIAVRNRILPAVGESPVWDEARIAPYVTTSTADITGRLPFDELRAALIASHDRLTAGIARLDDAALAHKAPFSPGNNPEETVQSLLTGIVVHESYHAGQIGMLRREMGKDGAIAIPAGVSIRS